jgi:predicted peptidase
MRGILRPNCILLLALFIVITGEAWGCTPLEGKDAGRTPTVRSLSTLTSTPKPKPPWTSTSTAQPSASPTLSAIPTSTPTVPALVGQKPVIFTLTEEIAGDTQQVTMRCLLFLPATYDRDSRKRWPLILFLHGSGAAGSDLNLLKRVMLPKYLEDHPGFPFIVVSPQIPKPGPQSYAMMNDTRLYVETYGWDPWIERLNLLLDAIQTDYRVDSNHVYLTGLSLGGFGAWNYALRFPDRFTAIVPVAGGYRYADRTVPVDICRLKDLPIWVFHGAKDTTVYPWQSELLVDALKACGGKVRLTIFPENAHDIWDQVYSDPSLYRWFLAQGK